MSSGFTFQRCGHQSVGSCPGCWLSAALWSHSVTESLWLAEPSPGHCSLSICWVPGQQGRGWRQPRSKGISHPLSAGSMQEFFGEVHCGLGSARAWEQLPAVPGGCLCPAYDLGWSPEAWAEPLLATESPGWGSWWLLAEHKEASLELCAAGLCRGHRACCHHTAHCHHQLGSAVQGL